MSDQEWFDSWQGPKSLYQSGSVWSAWIGWNTPLADFGVTGRQAVATGMDGTWNAAIESCAKIAENPPEDCYGTDGLDGSYLAEAIRSLAEEGPEDQPTIRVPLAEGAWTGMYGSVARVCARCHEPMTGPAEEHECKA